MDEYNIRLNAKALRDIDDIFSYISHEKQSPRNAKRQTDRIWEALKALETFPQSHQERTIGKYADKDYRQLIIDNYLAIFKIDDANREVHVITVQYQGREL